MTAFKWPSPVYVYDLEDDKFVREFATFAQAKKFVDSQEVWHGITVEKIAPIKLLAKRFIYSNDEDQIEIPATKVQEWLSLTLRSKTKVEALPIGLIEYLVGFAKDAYYNTSEPIMSDAQYDRLEDRLKRLFPKSTILNTGAPIRDEHQGKGVAPEKVELPHYMGSMNKMKDNVESFMRKYPGPFTLSDKGDGISLLYSNVTGSTRLYTRGDGRIGQDVSHLIPMLSLPKLKAKQSVRGELMMSKTAFKKYAEQFKNARNMMAGVVNRKSVSKELAHAKFVAFQQVYPVVKQSTGLEALKAQGFTTIWWTKVAKLKTAEITKILMDRKEKSPYVIDGLVVSDDNKHATPKSGNPDYAFAFKSNAAFDSTEATVVDISWEVSRHNQIKPTILIEPVDLDGVTVSRATAHHAKYIYDNKIGPGAILRIVRSGGVIPYVEEIVKPAKKPLMPKIAWEWDKTQTNIIAVEKGSKNQKVTQLNYCLVQLGVESIGIGLCNTLYDLGFEDIVSLAGATVKQLAPLGPTRSKQLVKNLEEAIDEADAVQLMVVSGVFGMGIGNTKLKSLLDQYPNFATLSKKQAMLLDTPKGFSYDTFQNICDNLSAFHKFVRSLGRDKSELKVEEVKKASNKLGGKTFLFSGFRDAAAEEIIRTNGGTVASGFSTKVTHMVLKDLGSGSSKAAAARQAGIPILDKAGLDKMLKSMKLM